MRTHWLSRLAWVWATLLAMLCGCSDGGGSATPDTAEDDATLADATVADAAPLPDAAWQPEAEPWAGYPDHPFREQVGPAGRATRLLTLSPTHAIAAGDDGLTLLDFTTQPASTQGRLDMPSRVTDLALAADGSVLVAAGTLAVVDAQPGGPTLTHQLDVEITHVRQGAQGPVFGLSSSQLVVVDTSPNPELRGRLDLEGAVALAVSPDGQWAFVGLSDGLAVVSASDPSTPRLRGRLETDAGLNALVLSADGAMLFANTWDGLLAIDVSDPSAPDIVSRTAAGRIGWAPRLALSADEQRLFSVRGGALVVLDVADPAAIVEVGAFEAISPPIDARPLDAHRILVASADGVMPLDLRNPGTPPILAQSPIPIEGPGQPLDVQLSPDERTAFIGNNVALTVVDMTTLTDPATIVSVPALREISNLHVAPDGQTLYVAGWAGVSVVDVEDVGAPVVTTTFDTSGLFAMDVVTSRDGQTAFVATESAGGLDVVDLEGAPSLLGQVYVRHTESLTLTPDERTVFVADFYEDGLLAFDVSDPTAPQRIGQLLLPVRETALSQDGTLLLAISIDGLALIDVSDPSHPEVIGELPLPEQHGDVAISNDSSTAFVSAGAGGLLIVDIQTPEAPVIVGVIDTPGAPLDLAVFEDATTAVVAAERAVAVVDLSDSVSLEPAAAAPEGRRYTLRWDDRYPEHPEQIAWHATSGVVRIAAIDQTGHTAQVDWTDAAPGARLTVAVGNHHYYRVARVANAP